MKVVVVGLVTLEGGLMTRWVLPVKRVVDVGSVVEVVGTVIGRVRGIVGRIVCLGRSLVGLAGRVVKGSLVEGNRVG